MPRFDDYHRTVVGYHGTSLTAALRLVNRIEGFRPSEKDYDWLGRGIYFWEYAPKQALDFAKIRQRQLQRKANKTPREVRRVTQPLAVVGAMIRLGFCFDLTESANITYLEEVFHDYKESMELAGNELPRNTRKYRKLDRAVFEYAYRAIETADSGPRVDTSRGIYVPTGGLARLWDGSWISRNTQIQLCVRNPANLLGLWLYYPTDLGVDDVRQAIQADGVDVGGEDPPGQEEVQGDDEASEA